jgi:trans-feruloyl-CoA hydratase/vanillin synthase
MSSTYETVKVEHENGIAWVILNRPDKRNAMSPQLHYDMCEVLDELEHDPQAKVLVLTGAGDAWCAGQDLKLFFRDLDNKPVERTRAAAATIGDGKSFSPTQSPPSPWSTASASAAASPS